MADGKGHYYGGDLGSGHMNAPQVGGMSGGSSDYGMPASADVGGKPNPGEVAVPFDGKPLKKGERKEADETGTIMRIGPKQTPPRQVIPAPQTQDNSASPSESSQQDIPTGQGSPQSLTPSKPVDTTPWWKQPGSKATPQQIRSLDSTAAFDASPEGIAKQEAAAAKRRKGMGKFQNDEE